MISLKGGLYVDGVTNYSQRRVTCVSDELHDLDFLSDRNGVPGDRYDDHHLSLVGPAVTRIQYVGSDEPNGDNLAPVCREGVRPRSARTGRASKLSPSAIPAVELSHGG